MVKVSVLHVFAIVAFVTIGFTISVLVFDLKMMYAFAIKVKPKD
ncbi:hypothetical protein [Clostridium sp. 3-3]|nr:hypothetical protein [Clostridium sp. 3-3]